MGRHRDVNLEQVISLLDRIGGVRGLEVLLQSSVPAQPNLEGPKYGKLTLGEIEAIFNLLVKEGGPDALEKMRKGTLAVKFGVENEGANRKATKLYDRYGRVIAPKGFSDLPLCADRRFNLTLPGAKKWHSFDLASLNLVEHYDRIRPFVPANCGITLPTREEIFQSLVYCEEIRNRLREDEAQKNILHGAHLPTILPICEMTNHGALVEILFEIAKRSYEAEFPGRKFNYYLEGNLVGQIRIAPESRFLEIRSRMLLEFVSGLTFFTPFQGYSIPAGRQMINLLPEECALSCFDTIWSWVLYPEILLSRWETPRFDLAGFFWGSDLNSVCGRASDNNAYFDNRDLDARRHFSAGLFFSR